MLDYDLGARGETPLYEYLYQRIRDDILRGAIRAGERLPSKRALAQHLGVSVVTVEGAYAQLVAEGYVRSRARSGYFACAVPVGVATPAAAAGEADSLGAPRLSRGVEDGARWGSAGSSGEDGAGVWSLGGDEGARSTGVDEVGRPSSDEGADLTSPSSFSGDAARLWARALRQTLALEPEDEVFSAAPAQGSVRLRRAIATHLRATRGLDVSPSNIVVGAGAQMLYVMISQLVGTGCTFAVEDPGYVRLTRIYEACGQRVRHVPLDGQGVRVDALGEADVLHLMPSHQYPTGRVTSISRRYELLGWASARPGRWLVEDDYDCEFRLAGRPVPALLSIDADGSVIYTNTFSKSLGSALRLAYMVLPDELMERYARELGFYSSTVSSVQQVALARILESGDYERHVARVRKRCRDVRDALASAVRSRGDAGRIRIEEADSGLHAVLAIDDLRDAEGLASRAAELGIPEGAIVPMRRFLWDEDNGIDDGSVRFVVPYDALTPEAAGLFAGLRLG